MCVCVQAEGPREVKVRGARGMVGMEVCEVKVGEALAAGGEVLHDKKFRWRLNKRCF